MLSRSAIYASGIVVCECNSQASSIFLGSTFRRALRSASLQPIRFDTAAAPLALADASRVAHSAVWKRRSNCPGLIAGRFALMGDTCLYPVALRFHPRKRPVSVENLPLAVRQNKNNRLGKSRGKRSPVVCRR